MLGRDFELEIRSRLLLGSGTAEETRRINYRSQGNVESQKWPHYQTLSLITKDSFSARFV